MLRRGTAVLLAAAILIHCPISVASDVPEVGAAGPAWMPEGEVDGGELFTRARPGSDISEGKMIGTLDAPPAAVWALAPDRLSRIAHLL